MCGDGLDWRWDGRRWDEPLLTPILGRCGGGGGGGGVVCGGGVGVGVQIGARGLCTWADTWSRAWGRKRLVEHGEDDGLWVCAVDVVFRYG
jgi:hypothetical protein